MSAEVNARATESGYGEDLELDDGYHVTGQPNDTHFERIERPVSVTDAEIRCSGRVPLRNGQHKRCNKLLAELAGRPWVIECPRCHTKNKSPEHQAQPSRVGN